MSDENNVQGQQPGAPSASENPGKPRKASGKKKATRKPKAASRYVVMLESQNDEASQADRTEGKAAMHTIIGEGSTMSAAWSDALAKEIPGVAQCYCLRGSPRTMAEQRKFGFAKEAHKA